MADLFAWLISFFLVIGIIGIILFQSDKYGATVGKCPCLEQNLGCQWDKLRIEAISFICLSLLMCLADLEYDYINPYDSASRVNKAVLPEFIAQGVLCLLHLTTGHWIMFLLCLPYAYYNVTIYTRRQHFVDVTEIFNQLPWEKKVRLFKLGYLVIFLALTIFWMIWSIVDE